MPKATEYDTWSREALIARLLLLSPSSPKPPPPKPTSINFQAHTRRKIALKFSYFGPPYNGLAFQTDPTPLPTVEGVLFDACVRTCLVEREGGFEGCGWERCGRTDRGVSAAGQVVSLWVRSVLDGEGVVEKEEDKGEDKGEEGEEDELIGPSPSANTKPKNELRYVAMLNRVLPPTIRILAWSPVSPAFSARFACISRHYKYFFTTSGLDVSSMRSAASRLVGEHDFRNMCRLDASKGITQFRRTILRADIEVEGEMGVFNLVGNAFLYHQVRHIMAILFLVGMGLEHPSVISALLNVDGELAGEGDQDAPLEIVDCKPEYQMADALPLMLWDCAYPDSEVSWRAEAEGDLMHQLRAMHDRTLIQAALEEQFCLAAGRYHAETTGGEVINVPVGGGTFRRTGKYVPLLRRNRLERYELTNERWKNRKTLNSQ